MKKYLQLAISSALQAGKEILEVYKNEDISVNHKLDNSPITQADLKSHQAIVRKLISTPFPVLSEEGRIDPFDIRVQWDKIWIIDPLDGTKEFIKKNGEFTVNIALVQNNEPILGVIYIPVLNILYFGCKSIGAYKLENAQEYLNFTELEDLMDNSRKLPLEDKHKNYKVAVSRSHVTSELEEYIKNLTSQREDVEIITAGSSLKLCLVAEGVADEYPRFGPSMEWDIAAGHAIIKAAGGKVNILNTTDELKYNKSSLMNPFFIAG
jgi:3'(2'), 5'-bisphosphate nucleotidase